VPIFQEQVMQLAILAADFTPGEADQLRRAMAAWKRKGGLGPFHERLVGRMVAKGYTREYAERIFKQIEGFGEYGFPESHAASFALLVYVSAWLKCHHPDAFLAALLNSQPMGFYAPAQLVRDAKRARRAGAAGGRALQRVGQRARGAGGAGPPVRPVRLGFNRISGFPKSAARALCAARRAGALRQPEDLARRAALDAHELALLAQADALAGSGGPPPPGRLGRGRRRHPRHAAAARDAHARGAGRAGGARCRGRGHAGRLPQHRPDADAHPLALLREAAGGLPRAAGRRAARLPHGQLARASGLVTHRQRPETAKGVVFVTLEDETGTVNVIVWPHVAEAQRRPLLASTLLTVYGVWQREGEVRAHLVAHASWWTTARCCRAWPRAAAIVPLKTLDYESPVPAAIEKRATEPLFSARAAELIGVLKKKTPAEVATLMGLSDPLARSTWRATAPGGARPRPRQQQAGGAGLRRRCLRRAWTRRR
jgi:error-prone DNA polymerase